MKSNTRQLCNHRSHPEVMGSKRHINANARGMVVCTHVRQVMFNLIFLVNCITSFGMLKTRRRHVTLVTGSESLTVSSVLGDSLASAAETVYTDQYMS